MDEKIVEAFARAICAEGYHDPDGTDGLLMEDAPLVPDKGDPNWTAFVPVARAAWDAARAALAEAGFVVVPRGVSRPIDGNERRPRVSIGAGGDYQIDGRHAWHLMWLPKGYGPSLDDFVVCTVACPPHEKEQKWWRMMQIGQRPALLQAIAEAIEQFFMKHPTPGQKRWPLGAPDHL